MNHQMTSMNQKIFEMGFSVETVSAYLLCCALADEDITISIKNLLIRWNSTEQVLFQSIEALENRKIINRILSDGNKNAIFRINDINDWTRD